METEMMVTGDKLEVKCTGVYHQAELMKALDSIDEIRNSEPAVRKCIMDMTGADFRVAGIGEFFIGEYAARKLSGIRISLIINPGQINKLMENAAYNRGLKILLAESRDQALAWLDQ